VALSLIDLFAEAVLRWSLRCDRPAHDLTALVIMAVHGGRDDPPFAAADPQTYDVEQMRLALHDLTVEPGLREDFLVRALVRELDDALDDQVENFGRYKARARRRVQQIESALAHPALRERFLDEHGLTDRQARSLLNELRRLASTADGIEELARRRRALDAWRDLSGPVVAPDLLREWRESRLVVPGEPAGGDA
jgi:hypothetical protein